MSRNPDPHYHRLFLSTIRENPGCTIQKLKDVGISFTTCCTLIGRYELEQIRVQRDSRRRVTGIWILEDAA